MTTPSAFEQEILELINRARMDPIGETQRMLDLATTDPDVANAVKFFEVDLSLFQEQMTVYSSVAPLAWSDALGTAAKQHSELMIEYDTQSHQLPGEPGLGDRIKDAGYNFQTAGENIFAFGKNPVQSHAAFFIDWGNGPGGMQSPAGHRINIMNPDFSEAGISALLETDPSTNVGELVITHNLGADLDQTPYILGVVFDDLDQDGTYDAGEGLDDITVEITGDNGTLLTSTWESGGYQMNVPAGIYTVTFSGGALPAPITHTTLVQSSNVKLDMILDPAAVQLPSTTAGNDTILLSPGDEAIDGLTGTDTVTTDASSSQFTMILSNENLVTLIDRSDSSQDTLKNIEIVEFGDLTIDLRDFDNAHTLPDAQYTELAEMYAAYFNRAPDAIGLAFWADKYAEGLALKDIAELFFDQNETRALYSDLNNNEDFAEAVYANVLGRAPDQSGFNFWTDLLDAQTVSKGEFVLEVIKGAKSATGSKQDADYLAQKTDLGLYFSTIHGMSDVNDAINIMQVFGNQANSNQTLAKSAVENHYTEALAPESGDFLVILTGVVPDPFAA